MRHILISVLLLGLVSACSNTRFGPHRIDVQQGNALDQENVARLKPGLNRSQVRFLLGTPLVVDPFRNDRWDYVYIYYKAGKLAEQKRISLFFDGDTLARIEGDVPPPDPAAASATAAPKPEPSIESKIEPKAQATVAPGVEAQPLARPDAPRPEPMEPATAAPPAAPSASPATVAAQAPAPQPAPAEATKTPVPTAPAAEPARPAATAPVAPTTAAAQPVAPASDAASVETSIVAPLPSPKNAPAYRDARAPADLALRTETEVDQIRPDAIPPFPEPGQTAVATARDEAVLGTVRNWARAWSGRDADAYLAVYDVDFVPPGGSTRADWEKRRRLLLGASQQIEVKVESPTVEFLPDGSATVTFTQQYRSDSHRDTVVKQLRLVERNGRWLIVDERVLSRGGR